MIDVGDVLPGFAVAITDAAGAPAAPGALTVSLRAPDGAGGELVLADPVDLTILNPVTGTYRVSYTAPRAGTYTATWTATGANAGAHRQVWTVTDEDLILSVAAARSYLRVAKPSDEEELRDMLAAVSSLCERYTRRRWRRVSRTLTTYGPGTVLEIPDRPLRGVSAVTVDGVLQPASSYTVDAGRVTLTFSPRDTSVVTVTYAVGPADGRVPAYIVHGCKLLAAHLWDTQRGGSNLPRRSGGEDEIEPQLSLLPPRVRQAWGVPRMLVR